MADPTSQPLIESAMKRLQAGLWTILTLSCLWQTPALAGNRVTVSSGNWSSPATWHPTGVPASDESVRIRTGHAVSMDMPATVLQVTVENGGELILGNLQTLTVTSALEVDGQLNMSGGNIQVPAATPFILGSGAEFTWDPGDNSVAGASLFVNGIEQFDPASTLIIRKWYNYNQVPLGAVVSGNFGNLVLNSIQGNVLMEWNQDNQFEAHPVLGTLTVDHGWVVLDKSGSISHTVLGGIQLLNANSFLDFHGGTHPGTLKVETGQITNLGGHLNGIYNGNGNIELHITGNLQNYGNIVLVYNSGVAGTGDGNAAIKVDGQYFQSKGDFRGVFNITSLDAGTVDMQFGAFNLSGGVFIGHYACHQGTGVNRFAVKGNFSISCQSALDKFRVSGLTSLAGTYNTAGTAIDIEGSMLLSGHDLAEVTTSGSIGSETITIGGDAVLAGCAFSANMGSHRTTIDFNGNVQFNGGRHFLSRTPGHALITVHGDLTLSGGHLSLKGNSGSGSLVINGGYKQTGGIHHLHDNQTYTSTDTVTWVLHGPFHHHGGTINFDNHPNTKNNNRIVFKGKSCYLEDNGIIMQASGFGTIVYAAPGVLTYQRPGNSHLINRIRQVIAPGCTLDVQTGNLQISSSPHHAQTDMLIINGQSALKMGTHKIVSNFVNNYSGLIVHDHGRLSTQNPNGLYNGTDQACINATGNMSWFLGRKSVIEYNGTDNQVLTGLYPGANADHNKYGILEINFQGTPDLEKVTVDGPSVHVRTQLVMINGELSLNNSPIAVESGKTSAIKRVNGYIKADFNDASNKGFVHWMNMTTGIHVFPFGYDSEHFLPFVFTPVSGMGKTVSVTTRATGPDNLPLPGSFGSLQSIMRDGSNIAVSSVIDRWYEVNAPGYVADISLCYRGVENTTADSLKYAPFGVQAWNGYGWTRSFGSAFTVRNGVGTISLDNVSQFGHWILSTRTEKAAASDFIEFTAVLAHDAVLVRWTVHSAAQALRYIIERSADNRIFSPIRIVDPQPSATEFIAYSDEDPTPLSGRSYYRVRQENFDGSSYLSSSERIDYNPEIDQNLQILTLAPNPFTEEFAITYYALSAGNGLITLTDHGGRLVDQWPVNMTEGLNTYKYRQKQNLQPGIYVLTLTAGRSMISRKIIKT